jgi:hypothetical protein
MSVHGRLENTMNSATIVPLLLGLSAGAGACGATPSDQADGQPAPVYGVKLPAGYRDWKLVSVAREEGLADIRAVLGNDVAVAAYRAENLPFPDGSIIARIAWEYLPSEENENAFVTVLKLPPLDHHISFVAGAPKNGVQFMVKDSKKFASSGGWGYAQFNDGKPADEKAHKSCFPCHDGRGRDSVFTRYAQ